METFITKIGNFHTLPLRPALEDNYESRGREFSSIFTPNQCAKPLPPALNTILPAVLWQGLWEDKKLF